MIKSNKQIVRAILLHIHEDHDLLIALAKEVGAKDLDMDQEEFSDWIEKMIE